MKRAVYMYICTNGCVTKSNGKHCIQPISLANEMTIDTEIAFQPNALNSNIALPLRLLSPDRSSQKSRVKASAITWAQAAAQSASEHQAHLSREGKCLVQEHKGRLVGNVAMTRYDDVHLNLCVRRTVDVINQISFLNFKSHIVYWSRR